MPNNRSRQTGRCRGEHLDAQQGAAFIKCRGDVEVRIDTPVIRDGIDIVISFKVVSRIG